MNSRAVHDHVTQGVTEKLGLAALSPVQKEMRRVIHQSLMKATDDIGRRRNFNTAIAAMMELLNAIGRFADASPAGRAVRQEALETATLALSPIIPHVCHVLWSALGRKTALIDERWPEVDKSALVQDSVEIVVQVNGKLRGRVSLPVGADETAARDAAVSDEQVKKFIVDKPIRKVIVVPGKLINIVV